MKQEDKNRKEMRGLLFFMFLLIVADYVFELNFSIWLWIIISFIVFVFALTHTIDLKIRALDQRIKKLEREEY